MTMLTFYEWDYERGVYTQYHRMGSCNGCGQCCRARIVNHLAGVYGEIPFEQEPRSRVGTGTNGTGVWLEASDDQHRWFVQTVEILPGAYCCPKLTEDDRCGVHEEKNALTGHLALCALWPMGPSHIAPFDGCSYEFIRIGEWALDAQGVEHQIEEC